MALDAAFFTRPAVEVARELIGATLRVGGVGGVIVETEAYEREDPASHSYVGATARNAAMFGPAGRAYVYRSYGVHWCLNFVCGPTPGHAVLIRALEPTAGIALMQGRRGLADVRRLCAGPGRLSQALAVDRGLDGSLLDRAPFELLAATGSVRVQAGPRIGISKAVDQPWRFGLADSAFLSRPFPATPGRPNPAKPRRGAPRFKGGPQ